MSLENQDVFQFLKEVAFRRILAFCSSRKWGYFLAALSLFLKFPFAIWDAEPDEIFLEI
jgi:hypothetical protein